MSSASTTTSTMSVLISGRLSLLRTESSLDDTRYMKTITPDISTARILPIICAFVNCDVKSYRNISSKNALTAIKYFNGRISNLNILNNSNPDTISCIRTNIRPISVPQPRLFLFRSFLESSSLFLNKYFISSLLLVKKLDIIHSLITLG